MRRKLKNNNGITLIALVVTIVVLLILAGVSISMLTGENGIITQAQKSKIQTEIGKEKEYITLSVSAVKGDKISRGDTSEITSGELQNEINNYTDEATVTGSGTLTVTYESGRSYDVEQDGSITEKEELTPEEAKKIVYATGCGEIISPSLLVETADETVYYVDNLQEEVMQKIEIIDAKVIATNGIKNAGSNYFIDNQGKVYTWGDNRQGQLGNGTNESSNEPICISDIPGSALNGKNIVKIQGDSTMIALDSEGKVYTWGENVSGQLGNGTSGYNTSSYMPICISDIPENALNGKNIVEIQCSYSKIIALDSEGKVYTWGYNLGDGTNENSNVPICISDIPGNALNGKDIKIIHCNNSTTIVLDSEGKVYTWGENSRGQLGNGTNESSNAPICISDIPGNVLNGKHIIKAECYIDYQGRGYTTIALDSEGKVYTWGYNGNGQLGNGAEAGYDSYNSQPQCISDIPENVLNGKNIKEIQYCANTLVALDNEGKIYTWGNNGGSLGNGTDEDSNEPICISDMPGNVLNGKNIKEIYNAVTKVGIDNEKKVYIWGNSRFEDGTYENSNLPICITDNQESELYNKKIELVNISYDECLSFITEDGELYNYYYSTAV